MKKIYSLHFWFLPLEAHFEFFKRLSRSLSVAGAAVKAAIAALLPEFDTWLSKEDALLQWVRKSDLTQLIAEADRRTDHALSGLNAAVKAALYSLDTAVATAANRIHIMLKNYGKISHKSYDKEEADVEALLEQFAGPYAADATTVGLSAWIGELQAAFTDFEGLLLQREAQQVQKPPYTFKDVRKGIEDVYHRIEKTIDAGSVLGTSPDFDAFIDLLNPDIDRLNTEFHHAKHDLAAGDHTVIESIPTQAYTGKPITVVPNVYYRADGKPAVELVLGTDFSVTYKNNKEAGMADLTIHGKGKYKGQKTATFNIARV